MLVFWTENLVLLAMPKTGTTALETALAPRAAMITRDAPQLKHVPCFRYNRFLRPFLTRRGGRAPEVMAITRHPVDWLGSWYRYRTRDYLAGHENSTRGISFDDFIVEYCKEKPAPFASVGSQDRFLRIRGGDLGVDHLFRYEAWDKMIAFLEDRLNMTLTLERQNVSPMMDMPLSDDVLAHLHEKRPAEFAIWQAGQG